MGTHITGGGKFIFKLYMLSAWKIRQIYMPISAKKGRERRRATTTVISDDAYNYGDICLYIYIYIYIKYS